MYLNKRILIAFLLATQSPTISWAAPQPPASAAVEILPTDPADVLKKSQVSYRAEGGFSGVESYGSIISCVNGEVSIMASIHDPRSKNGEPTRKICHMTQERYLAMWNSLVRQASLRLTDGPALHRETLDEFTVTFNLSVGSESHQFRAQGLSLPECARYEAVRSIIDDAAQMAEVWKAHDDGLGLSKSGDAMVTFESLNSNLDVHP